MRLGKRIGAMIPRWCAERGGSGVGIAREVRPGQRGDEDGGNSRLLGETIAHFRQSEAESAGATSDGLDGAAIGADPKIRVGQGDRVVKFRSGDDAAAPAAPEINPAIAAPLRSI